MSAQLPNTPPDDDAPVETTGETPSQGANIQAWWSKDGDGPVSLLNVFAQYMSGVEANYREKGLTVEADLFRQTIEEAHELKRKFASLKSQAVDN